MLLNNARLVAEQGIFTGSLAIEEGVVSEIRATPYKAGPGVCDCGGLLLLPGMVDVHVHANDPGNASREDFTSVTAAAAAGGITTIVDMPIDAVPPPVDRESFLGKLRVAESKCLVDFALWGGLIEDNTMRLAEMSDIGAPGFKAFMVYAGDNFPHVSETTLKKGLAAASALGKPVLVHAEDAALCGEGEQACRKYGRNSVDDFLAVRTLQAENAAVETALRLAESEHCRIHICHASNSGAVDLVRAARKRGVDASVETCMHYLLFTDADLRQSPNGMKCLPPLRGKEEQDSLWRNLLSGDIDIVSSDHSPCEPGEKSQDLSIWDAWGGINSIQATLTLLFSEGVVKRGMDLRDMVRVLSENPAKLAGIYPQKGGIRLGGDADLVLFDPDAVWRWSKHNWHTRYKNTPYLGFAEKGAVVMTMLRGKPVFSNNCIAAQPGWGKHVFSQRRKQL